MGSLALVAGYPFMKRITYWPQAFLGLTFNWGIPLGWAAASGGLAWPAAALYAGAVAWTIGYDTIYALQDREDDLLIGVKSTALKFGRHTRAWVAGFYLLALCGWALAGWLADLGWPYALGLLAVAAHFAWQLATLDTELPGNCQARFKSNKGAGLLLAAGILGSYLWTA